MKQIFDSVNKELNNSHYELSHLEGGPTPAAEDSPYKPHKVLKSVCNLIERGARIIVSSNKSLSGVVTRGVPCILAPCCLS